MLHVIAVFVPSQEIGWSCICLLRDRRGRHRMVVGFTTTYMYAIGIYLIDLWCLKPFLTIFQLFHGDHTVGTMPKSYSKFVERSTIDTANT